MQYQDWDTYDDPAVKLDRLKRHIAECVPLLIGTGTRGLRKDGLPSEYVSGLKKEQQRLEAQVNGRGVMATNRVELDIR